jgi:2-phosphoglycolate phosphatase
MIDREVGRPRAALRSVLFDLDGTLVDTAADLGFALNQQRLARGLSELSVDDIRSHASSGARGLLLKGFGLKPDDASYLQMRDEFLDLYEQNLCRSSSLFPGMGYLLDKIESRGLAWGIVTNKAERFTLPLLQALKLTHRTACIVCGDTTPYAKPHPAPLLEALQQIGSSAQDCVYVGDDERDVQAGHAAGMPVIVVLYGYLGNGRPPEEWGADSLVDSPRALGSLLFDEVG